MTTIRLMADADWPAVEAVYAQGIADGEATFEVATPSWEVFAAARRADLRFVAVDAAGEVVGWVASTAVSSRPAYRGVVEHSVYVDRGMRGRGVGRLLLNGFIEAAEDAGIWTIQSSIFPENEASVRLHESLGFRPVGIRERIARAEIGPRAGEWRDTLLIERRSIRTGGD